jgi:PAS domain S-box-containing protein
LTGFSQSEILNCHISVLFDVEALAAKPLRFDLLNKGDSIIIEREIVHKNGTRIPVEMNSKRPHANYYLTVIRDLSERHKAQSDLLAINKQ